MEKALHSKACIFLYQKQLLGHGLDVGSSSTFPKSIMARKYARLENRQQGSTLGLCLVEVRRYKGLSYIDK